MTSDEPAEDELRMLDTNKGCMIDRLDDNSLFQIFTHLDYKNLLRCEQVNKRWRSITLMVWRSKRSIDVADVIRIRADSCDLAEDAIMEKCLAKTNYNVVSVTISDFEYESVGFDKVIVQHCPHLESLVSPENVGLIYITEHCRYLKKLDVRGCDYIPEDEMKTLVLNCPHLEEFRIWCCPNIRFFKYLPRSLRVFEVEVLGLQDDVDNYIPALCDNCPDMCELYLDCLHITPESLSCICEHMGQLRTLSFSFRGDDKTERRFQDLAKLARLKDLRLQMIEMSRSDFQMLQKCQGLQRLELDSITFTENDSLLSHLIKMINLEYLNLSLCDQISPEGLSYVSFIPRLRSITLFGSNVDDAGIEALLREATCLHTVDISHCSNITVETFNHAHQYSLRRNIKLNLLTEGNNSQSSNKYLKSTNS